MGHDISWEPYPPSPQQPPTYQVSPPYIVEGVTDSRPDDGKKKTKKILLIVVAIVALLLFSCCAFTACVAIMYVRGYMKDRSGDMGKWKSVVLLFDPDGKLSGIIYTGAFNKM